MFNMKWIKNIIIVIVANGLLAFGAAFFLVPMNIVNGGMSGVSLLLLSWFQWPVELTNALLSWFFFILGFILLGKSFSAKTLVSTILYPIFFFIFLRFIGSEWIGLEMDNETHRLLASLFGGSFVGVGIGMSFLAGGSTGGFDVVMLAGQKYAEWKPSLSSFVIDAVIIFLGMITFGVLTGLYGILSTVATSIMMELVFTGLSRIYTVTVISKEHQKINQFIIEKLERGSTLYPAKGGYSQQPLEVIQVAIQRQEYFLLKQMISQVDPNAFVMIAQARSIHGLGFDPLVTPILKRKKRVRHG